MSKEFEPISLGELRKTNIPQLIEKNIQVHQVPLFDKPDADEQGGSGTLVSFGSIKGILTATHVIAKLVRQKQNVIYVPYIPRHDGSFSKANVPFNKGLVITIDDLYDIAGNSHVLWRETWLDISLIRLDESTYQKLIDLGGKRSVDLHASYLKYNTDKQKYGSNDNRGWFGAIHGCPREDTHESEPNIIEIPYSGSYIGGPEYETATQKLKVSNKNYRLIPDLISMSIGTTLDSLPKNFAGASGGPLWKVTLRKDTSGNIQIDELFLGGVFVCAEQDEIDADNKLFSRGPKSLYDIFCKFLIADGSENT